MSSLIVAVNALKSSGQVTAIVGDKINMVEAPQGESPPSIIVHRVSEADKPLLSGSAGFPLARISIECRATTATQAEMLGEAVIASLRTIHLVEFAGREATFHRLDTDYSDRSDDAKIFRRIIDFALRTRQP